MRTKLMAVRLPEELQNRIAKVTTEIVNRANANTLVQASVSPSDTVAHIIAEGLAVVEPKLGIKPVAFQPKPKSKGGRPPKAA